MSKKQFLPIAIDITNKKILIIGGGEDAYKKLKILQRSTDLVEVLAPNIISWIKNTGIKYHEQQYDKEILKNYYLIYSCVEDPAFVRQLIRDCREANVLLNVHDQPDFCEFVSPAIYKQDNISIAVSSNGEDVFKSIKIRNQLKDYFENYRLQKLLIAN
ncbi:precorrin-2 dehydrogenase/sirohydrochlorin ferrochelatase family protein [Marinifilum sp. D737]|uniref:precorrin-2 dehydrogenase/sirohydrochlorin ferrochelatase family protein n=1 Tax=Marinifilum sp. D737 TaxID=2969628 RepID=UPI0022756608|nr:bifunctional precorrin-2 dehydrogenase/sirohydrochlorin ferrochelatase [Marinifilum sp. D737]MCY1634209.1 bifunctional precorrin-2 dehydrogenase/sirohydrochlorin ferrochelatase [Marinifilum sp. D737]